MKDSGIEWIGEIPEGWEVAPIRSCFDEVRTKNTNGQEQNALQFKFGNIISKTNFNANADDYVADAITNYTVVLPDTVMINGLNLNYDFKSLRVALVKEKGVITSAYLAIFPDRKKISPQYATYLFKGYETKMAFHNMGAGIRKTLGYKEFKNQPLLLPSEKEQNKISHIWIQNVPILTSCFLKFAPALRNTKNSNRLLLRRPLPKACVVSGR